MLTTRFKLPPLEGDDVAMLMERDLLRRWGFLGQQPNKMAANKTNTDGGEMSGTRSNSEGSDDDDNESDDENDSDESVDECDDNETMPDMENKSLIDVKENSDNGEGDKNRPGVKDCTGKGVMEDAQENKDKNQESDDKDGASNDKNQEDVKSAENEDVNNESCAKSDEVCSDGNTSLQCRDERVDTSLGVTENKIKEAEKAPEKDAEVNMKANETEESVTKNVPEKAQTVESKKEMSGEVLVLFQEATRHYDQDDFCDCMMSVEEAIEVSGADGHDGCDVDVTQLWLLRAKVMNSMENYKEALRSAYKVMARERPSRLWVEGAIAMEKLGIHVTAEMWIAMGMHKWKEENEVTPPTTAEGHDELWDAVVDSDVMCVLKMMQNRLRFERIYGGLVTDKPIKVIASVRLRKAIHATRKIKKGETIFQELPDILEQSIPTHRVTACAECAKSLLQPEDLITKSAANTTPNLIADIRKGLRKIWPKQKVVNCSFCREVKYCSEDCRKKSWDNHHKVICPSNAESTAAMLYDVRRSFRDVMAADGSTWQGWWNTEFSPTLLSRMTAIVLCKANLLADLRARENYSDSHWSMCEAILEKYSSCEKMHAAEQVPKMHELINNIFKRSKFLRYDLTKAAFNKLYSRTLTNVIKFHDTTHPMINFARRIKAENEKLYRKIKKYSGNSLEKTTMAEFHGLFTLASCLNHSCFPNAVVESTPVESRPGIAVKAVRDIRQGDEIVIAYVEPQMERHDRRKLLWKNYKFVCECPRCLHQGIGPHVCTNCGKTTSYIQDDIVSDPSVFMTSDDSKREARDEDTLNENVSGDSLDGDVPQNDTQQPALDVSQKTQSGECCTTDTAVAASVSEAKKNDNESKHDIVSCQDDSSNGTKSNDCNGGDFAADEHKDVGERDSDTRVQNDTDDASNKNDVDNDHKKDNDVEGKGIPETDETPSEMEPKTEVESGDGIDNIGEVLDSNTEQLKTEENPESAVGEKEDIVSKNESKSEPKSVKSAIKFAACGRCKKAWYCSVECQKDSWTNGHKRICNAV